jgi:hypothetical protein
MLQRSCAHLVAAIFAYSLGCTGIDVKTDYDKSVDFNKFHTFAFAGMTDLTQAGVLSNSLIRKRIESAIGQELTKKGLKPVPSDQDADLFVHYWAGVKDKQVIEATAPAMGGYGWYGRYGYGGGYGGVTTYDYQEGTLITDLIESTRKDLVWRATMVADLEDTAAGNTELIDQAVAEAFENYPPSKARQ